MRSTYHAPGSPAAQTALQRLAGWVPSRRGFIGSLLVAGAASTAAGTAAALGVPSAAPVQPGVSPRMVELIQIYQSASANIDSLDPLKDQAAWTAAEANWEASEVALMNQRPANAADFAAKFDTLLEIDTSEGEFARLKRLSEDAHALAAIAGKGCE